MLQQRPISFCLPSILYKLYIQLPHQPPGARALPLTWRDIAASHECRKIEQDGLTNEAHA